MDTNYDDIISAIRSKEIAPPDGDDELFAAYNVRTDLALEATEVMHANTGQEVPGAQVDVEDTEYAKITRMSIYSAQASRQLGKMPGHYSTIEAPGLRDRDRLLQEEVSQVFAKELGRFLQRIREDQPVLVVGLGNWNATPDALGPKVVNKLLVTRHLFEMSPPELSQGLRPVCAIAPGVLGITGMETAEIILGVVRHVRPAMVIAVDALASRSTQRLCTTIQIADTGVSPGSGIGNRRMGLTPETLGTQVIAVGVPTVVHAMTIASDAMDLLNSYEPPAPETDEALEPDAADENTVGFPGIGNFLINRGRDQDAQGDTEVSVTPTRSASISPQQKRAMLSEILNPSMGTLIVTPKNIDIFVDDVARVIAGGLNVALHPGVELADVMRYLQ